MADAGGIAADRLKSFIERIERLEEEKAALAGDIKEVYSEAKSTGFETKIMRQIIRLRKMDAQERAEQEQLLDVYKQAIGMVA
jgi:uncharacterized protein (UPF0335 family)